jgi:hypothetical protein
MAKLSKPNSWRDVLRVHPAAELFPSMSTDELRALGEDIKKNGLREGVAIIDDQLLDGRSRLDAMETVGIKLTTGNGQIEWAKIPFRNVKCRPDQLCHFQKHPSPSSHRRAEAGATCQAY